MTTDLAMQIRCPHCDAEQYAPAVFAFSYGERPCGHCGKYTVPMSDDEWRDRLHTYRANRTVSPNSPKRPQLPE